MTVYFKKINLDNLPLHEDFNSIKGALEFSHGQLKYFEIKDSAYCDLLRNYFKIPPDKIFLVEGHVALLPHRDKGQLSCINYYINSSGYTTNFWVPNSTMLTYRKGLRYNQTTESYTEIELGYHPTDLILVDSFLAKDKEAYILNINEIHSVQNPDSDAIRVFIQLQWDAMTIDELIRNLEF